MNEQQTIASKAGVTKVPRKKGIGAIIRVIVTVIGVIVGVALLGSAGVAGYSQLAFKRIHANRPLYQIQADTSPAGIERGKYLLESVMACGGACHTPEGGGPALSGLVEEINEGPLSIVFAPPNLTSDVETGLGNWTDAEIARAIREGIDNNGAELIVMPSFNYHRMSDADVAALVGYLRSLEPVKNEIPPIEANLFGKILYTFGAFGPKSVGEPITEAQTAPTSGTEAYGEYLVSLGACRDCHGMELAGGTPAVSSPDAPLTPNLTPAGHLAEWTEADFVTMMQTGMAPGGRRITDEMPWKEYGTMTEEDLVSIFKYLRSLPPTQPEK